MRPENESCLINMLRCVLFNSLKNGVYLTLTISMVTKLAAIIGINFIFVDSIDV